MPALGTVTALARGDLRTAGDFLHAVAAGTCEPADVVVVAVEAGGDVAADAVLDTWLAVGAQEVVRAAQGTGKRGQLTLALARAGDATVRIAFLGVGDRSPQALRRAGGELGRMLQPGEAALTSAVSGQPGEQIRALAEGIVLGSYRYSQKSAAAQDPVPAADVRLLVPAEPSESAAGGEEQVSPVEAITQGRLYAEAVALARDLTNTPSVDKCPQWLSDAAAKVAAEQGLAVRIWDSRELAAAGFGGITAVGAGSLRPPALIELSYEPAAARRHVVLVGKGITFDSGGLSLKPNDGMKAMKTDMAGGAAVIAAMSALARLGVTDKVTGLVAAAENMPSGSAYRPGDVITAYGGTTVEVLNTDAEGRLVLADALAYAAATLQPDEVVDLATLTGAVRIALGSSHAALYATSDDLATALLEAGERSGDRLWRMPLEPQYRSVLDSPVADLANISRGDSGAGSIVAALFLREFAGPAPWAHLDIAGAARTGADDGELTTGSTGFGTRLLLRWLTAGAA